MYLVLIRLIAVRTGMDELEAAQGRQERLNAYPYVDIYIEQEQSVTLDFSENLNLRLRSFFQKPPPVLYAASGALLGDYPFLF